MSTHSSPSASSTGEKPSSSSHSPSQQAHGVFDGLVINAAAYTHTSVALLDALKAVRLPAAEVHLTDIDAREPFRRISYVGMACGAHFKGLGFEGYRRAIRWLCSL